MWPLICFCLPALTRTEQQRFLIHLNKVIHTYDGKLDTIDLGLSFLPFLTPEEALTVLEERRDLVVRSQAIMTALRPGEEGSMQNMIQDHILTLLAAEVSWLDHTLKQLREQNEKVECSSS